MRQNLKILLWVGIIMAVLFVSMSEGIGLAHKYILTFAIFVISCGLFVAIMKK